MKCKLYAVSVTTKPERLLERAKITCKNFRDPVYGIALMKYVVAEMYSTIGECEADWLEMQILAKLHELESYLELYGGDDDEDFRAD